MNEKEMKAVENMMCSSNILAATLPDIARQLTRIADQGELRMALSDEPAPDALVEACKLAVSGDSAAKKGWCVNHDCGFGIDNMVSTELGMHIVNNALAAHEKAVR